MLKTEKLLTPSGAIRPLVKLLTLLIFSILPLISQAQEEYEWTGGDGDWNEPTNWDPEGIPGNGDEVYIEEGNVNYNVIGGGSVAALYLFDGTISGNEQLTVVDEFYWYAGTIAGTGTLVVSGTMYLEDPTAKSLNNKTLLITGVLSWSDGPFNINGLGKLSIDGGTFEFLNSTNSSIGGASGAVVQLIGGSTFAKSNASVCTIDCSLQVDDATLNLTAGEITFGPLSSSNLVSFAMTTSAGTKLNFNSGLHLLGSSTNTTGAGEFNIAGATVNLNGNNSIATSLNLSSGELGGTSDASLEGVVNWTNGGITSYGSITVFSTLNLTSTSTKMLSNGLLKLNDIMNWDDGDFTVNANATFSAIGGSNINLKHTNNQTLAGAGTITVAGHITKSEPSTTYLSSNFAFSGSSFKLNNGTFDCIAGSVSTFASSIQIGSSAIFEISDGTHAFNAGGAAVGSGTFKMSGGVANFNTGSQLSVDLIITSGTLTGNSNLTPKDYTQSGGTFTGTGSPTASGNMLWSSGTISGSGIFNITGTTTWTAGTRTIDSKLLMLNDDSFWNGGDFMFNNDGKIQSAINKIMTVDHNTTVAASGSGMLEIDGLIKLMNIGSTTNVNIEFKLDGTMTGNGTFTFGTLSNFGTISPGFSNIGKITFNDFINTNGIVEIELAETGTGGVNYDQLVISNSGLFEGTVNVSKINGFEPDVNDEFQIVDCNTCTGVFTIENLPELNCACEWESKYIGTGAVLRVVALLPVELAEFEVSEKEGNAQLNWATESEHENHGFQVEHSTDGLMWDKVGFVEGNGNSTQRNSYQFEHKLHRAGTFYYRLKQLDFDGQSEFSPVKSLKILGGGIDSNPTIFPNPTSGEFIQIKNLKIEGISHVSIFNSQSHLVYRTSLEESENSEFILSNLNLVPGYYLLQVHGVKMDEAIPFIVH